MIEPQDSAPTNGVPRPSGVRPPQRLPAQVPQQGMGGMDPQKLLMFLMLLGGGMGLPGAGMGQAAPPMGQMGVPGGPQV